MFSPALLAMLGSRRGLVSFIFAILYHANFFYLCLLLCFSKTM